MSTPKEQREAIEHAVSVAEKLVHKLETIQSVSKLHKSQVYELDMAIETVSRGKALLGTRSVENKVGNEKNN